MKVQSLQARIERQAEDQIKQVLEEIRHEREQNQQFWVQQQQKLQAERHEIMEILRQKVLCWCTRHSRRGMCVCVCVCVCVVPHNHMRDWTLGAAIYPSKKLANSVRRHTKVLADGEG